MTIAVWMAHRLTYDIWEEILGTIVLMNGDPIFLEPHYTGGGIVFNTLAKPYKWLSNNPDVRYQYEKRRPKSCIENIRRTCRGLYEAVDRMPKLWITKLWTRLAYDAGEAIPKLISELHNQGIPMDSGNSDLDIYLQFDMDPEEYDSGAAQVLLDLVARCGNRLRQLAISTDSVEFIEEWVGFEPKCPKLVRLKSFNFASDCPQTRDIGAALECPVLQNMQLKTGLDPETGSSPLPIITKKLAHVDTLYLAGAFTFSHDDFIQWAEVLCEVLPSLRVLGLSFHSISDQAYDRSTRPSAGRKSQSALKSLSVSGSWEIIREALVYLPSESTSYIQVFCDPCLDVQREWSATDSIRSHQLTRMWLKVTWCQLFDLFNHGGFLCLKTLHANVTNPSKFLPQVNPIRLPSLQLLHIVEETLTGSFCFSSMLGRIEAASLVVLRLCLSRTVVWPHQTDASSEVAFPRLQAIQVQIRHPGQIPINKIFIMLKDWCLPAIATLEIFGHFRYQCNLEEWRQAFEHIVRWSGSLEELTLMRTPSADCIRGIFELLPALKKLTIRPETFDVLTALSTPVATYDEVANSLPLPRLRQMVIDLGLINDPKPEDDYARQRRLENLANATLELLIRRKAAGAPVLEHLIIGCWASPFDQSSWSKLLELVKRVEIFTKYSNPPYIEWRADLEPLLTTDCCEMLGSSAV
jgi:hypothetical protein